MFLKAGAGPRAAAMGEAQTAVANDAHASYWNPAGLAQVTRGELNMTHQKSFQEIQEQNASFAYSFQSRGTIGAYATLVSVAPFPAFDASGSQVSEVDSSEKAVGLAYGYPVFSFFSLGAAVKMIRSSLGPSSASSHAFDAGALTQISVPSGRHFKSTLSLALVANNLGPAMVYDVEKTRLPEMYRIGAGYEVMYGRHRAVSAFDYHLSSDDKRYFSLGQEIWVNRLLALRGGYRFGEGEEAGPRGGVALAIKDLEFAYSLSPFGILGQSHRIGFTYRFGMAPRVPMLPPPVVEPVPALPMPVVLPAPAPIPAVAPSPAPVEIAPVETPKPKPAPVVKPRQKIAAPSKPAPKATGTPEPLYKSKQRILGGDVKALLERGNEHMRAGRYYEATVAFGQVLRVEPNNKVALEMMRKALNELDRSKQREKGIYE